MEQAKNKFNQLLTDINQVMTIYDFITLEVKAPLDTSDLLRWQWVQAISAFDKFVHDLVRIGMLEVFNNTRKATPKFNSFRFTFAELNNIKNSINQESEFEKIILMKHSYLAFQDPDKVNDALSFIWDCNDKWKIIAKNMGLEKDYCKKTLRNIVIRRNQIVHEGDYIDLYFRQEINKLNVIETINFIRSLGNIIYTICVSKENP